MVRGVQLKKPSRTMAVSAVLESDQVNSIIAAGRSDLCAVAHPHLADPAWTLHEAAKMQSRNVTWPKPHESSQDQPYREISREVSRQKKALPE